MFEISGKVAIVTGGGGVHGGSIARSLIKAGVKVAILDVREEQVNNRVKELEELGGEASCYDPEEARTWRRGGG